MNLSLKNRIALSFGIATLLVLVLSFTVFNFLNSLNKDIEAMIAQTNRASLLTDEIRISAVSILKYQRRILTNRAAPEIVEKIIGLCENMNSQLQRLDTLYKSTEVTKIVAEMRTYVDSLRVVLSKTSFNSRDTIGPSTIGELADKILEAFSEFQDIQYYRSLERDNQMKQIISETKRNMMITLIIGFLMTILLGLVVPVKLSMPFKKIKDTIRELQDCNFDVSIYYNQNDEIGEIATEMNKMIHNLKTFDDLRADRIMVEKRKFDSLANLSKKAILATNSEGRIMYMNNALYSMVQVQSDEVLGKIVTEAPLPKSIVDTCLLAVKRRSKIDNAEIQISALFGADDGEKPQHIVTILDKDRNALSLKDKEKEGSEVEKVIYNGYATIVPVRGKDITLDYYLFVMSEEPFV